MRKKIPLDERLLGRLDKTSSGGCWVWPGVHGGGGYGYIKIDGKQRYVHRVAYELLVGPIPENFQIDHLCRVRDCANPDHLEVVTQQENMRRGFGTSAQRSRQTHCKRGHEFTASNTYLWRTSRICRTCRAIQQASR